MLVRIVHPFHRLVPVEGDARQRRVDLVLGASVDVAEEEAARWIAEGLAVPIDDQA